jgi:hypothetical protein
VRGPCVQRRRASSPCLAWCCPAAAPEPSRAFATGIQSLTRLTCAAYRHPHAAELEDYHIKRHTGVDESRAISYVLPQAESRTAPGERRPQSLFQPDCEGASVPLRLTRNFNVPRALRGLKVLLLLLIIPVLLLSILLGWRAGMFAVAAMCVCVCVCVCIHTYGYITIHTHTCTPSGPYVSPASVLIKQSNTHTHAHKLRTHKAAAQSRAHFFIPEAR